MRTHIACLSDVDNTLLDNDRFEVDLHSWLTDAVGNAGAEAYWRAFEVRRSRLDYVDYLGAVQDCRDGDSDDPRWFEVGEYLLDYPFAERLFPGALDTLARLAELGPVWLISDGDAVMQPRKLRRAGLWDAVAGRVRIYVHKQRRLENIAHTCPADHYVLIDDKPAILQAVKPVWQDRVTTIMPRQGHYARAYMPGNGAIGPDIIIDHIAGLADHPQLRDLAPGRKETP